MLDIDRFDEFFTALHPETTGPFPWQRELARRVFDTGRWPALLDLQTGTGKTAAIDISVFLLALRRDHPRRIVFVVDRRVIVHQAAQRAAEITATLANATDGVLYEVAQALRGLASEEVPREATPLQCHELRGGIVRDDSWVRRPDVPAIIVSTVDQVGSRLLFRGYGVSRGMRPVHAGLLANDTLFLLDEVHLAKAFADTVGAIERHYRPRTDLPHRWQIARFSATADRTTTTEEPFTLMDADREPDCPLARVLAASKPVHTELVRVRGANESSHRQALADACARNVMALLGQGARAIGVVVNRVDTAARIHRQLRGGSIEPHLLTGRMRPLDRDRVLRSIEPRVSADRSETADDTPIALVSTQAIEAGANFDFDAIVTECASLDALIQRFGRVDRKGKRSAEDRTFTSVILATSASVRPGATDPVYGKRLRETWEWLRTQREFNFGVDNLGPQHGRKARTRGEVRGSSSPVAQPPRPMGADLAPAGRRPRPGALAARHPRRGHRGDRGLACRSCTRCVERTDCRLVPATHATARGMSTQQW